YTTNHKLILTSLLINSLTFLLFLFIFFFNDTATTEIYTLSLHDALPILTQCGEQGAEQVRRVRVCNAIAHGITTEVEIARELWQDRKSTRLNSSHVAISYAVFCLKKKKI